MKKLINRPEDVVKEALQGFAAAHRDLVRVNAEPAYVARAGGAVPGKVALVSGGGSGHEPLHAGFVGLGMLDAACPGAVFTSPTPDQILAASQAANGGAGILQLVKNYTGDVLNFELAAELAREEGLALEAVLVNDDVAVKDSLYTSGRRGVAATLLVEKLAGAAAEERRPLAEVAEIARRVNAASRSMGLALTSCTVPEAGRPTFALGEEEVELGIGIHGEPGRTRRAMASASELAELLAGPVLEDLPFRRGDEVLALVNGMGGTPLLELYLMFGELARILEGRGLTVARSLVGSYVTSLEMAGCSFTLLRLDGELARLWDAPVRTAALRWGAP